MEYRLLGTLEVVDEGRPVPVERRLSRVLLAFLLLHANEPVSVDRLVDVLWGESPPATAKASLQNHVARLRKALGAEAIVLRPGAYMLRIDPERIDLRRFERLVAEAREAGLEERARLLRAALALWRGSPLEDQVFEPFAQEEIPRLEELRLEAIEERVAADLALGRAAELVPELGELIDAHPFRERLRGQLVLALHRSGRDAEALAAAAETRRAWETELGMEAKTVEALERAIRTGDERLEQRAAAGEPEALESRRTVSVLFCDVVDSTRLATELDPEALRAVLSRYFEAARSAIVRHGGSVEKFIGDAVVAIFGVPELHEDDALRAARAAVETRATVEGLELRIAVATGEVVVIPAPGQDLHVAGAAVAQASRLQARAAPGQIVLDEATRRLLGTTVRATRLEPADAAGWLLEGVVGAAPPLTRRHDAPLVGRDRELSRLRAAFDAVCREGRCRVVTILGEPGIGKTRLARELADAVADEALLLVGRCVAYGEGATYLPLAEIVRQAVPVPSLDGVRSLLEGEDDAEQVAQRVAELAGLAEGPAAAGEAFWAVRRLFEALGRERPLLVVVDDVHWAEPTLLDLVEYLGEWTAAPMLLLCPGRPELAERRPGWAGPTSTGFAIELQPLEEAEARKLVERLAGESRLTPRAAAALVDRAGGNPLFAEQLVALAAEAPDERPPASLEALLASRLDRLDTAELHVLRRAAVVGRQFERRHLLDPAPADERALRGLTRRRLVHESGPDEFRFHHALVRDVAYRGIPKAYRAGLHERLADRLDPEAPDEIVGYHFEQAYRCFTDLGERGDRVATLAVRAGERLGRAGERAYRRGDVPAAVNLLGRATELLPADDPTRLELLCDLGVATWTGGAFDRASAILTDAAHAPVRRRDERLRSRARLELANLRLFREPEVGIEEFLRIAADAISVFEKAGDDRSLGAAWLLMAYVEGGLRCRHAAAAEAATRSQRHYRRAGWPETACLHHLAYALYHGPTPVEHAIAGCSTLIEGASLGGQAHGLLYLGGLESMRGNFQRAQDNVERSRVFYAELGWYSQPATNVAPVEADIALLRGDSAAAVRALQQSCEQLEELEDRVHLATQAADLGTALCLERRFDEAAERLSVARNAASSADIDAQIAWRIGWTWVLLARGRADDAETLAREAVKLAAPTDALDRQARAALALAAALRRTGREAEAAEAAAEAVRLLELKGNVVAAAHAARFARELTPA